MTGWSPDLAEPVSRNFEKMGMGKEEMTRAELLTRARAAAKVLAAKSAMPLAGVEACLELLSDLPVDDRLSSFQQCLMGLPIEERHYWIGTLYTLMLPVKVRRSQATYFTPPLVAGAVIELAIEAGFDIEKDDVLDPAAGGAAFLSTLVGRMTVAGVKHEDVARRLNGIEIDEDLARLSHRLIEERLGANLLQEIIAIGDALVIPFEAAYDLVIANPPYGRVSPDEVQGEEWRRVSYRGHINKYALFTELSFRVAKRGGLVVLVIPSSFRAGPLYDRMREFIRSEGEILTVASIQDRNGVFIDVAQDISVLVARKGEPHSTGSRVRFPVIGSGLSAKTVVEETLSEAAGAAWPFPATDSKAVGGATLKDYGVEAKAGYFVWNRESHRMRKTPGKATVYPLIWARNIRPGKLCRPAGKMGGPQDFVIFYRASAAVVTKPAAVMQRTTNDKQPRRLIVAMVDPMVVSDWHGFVTENHTIVLTADDAERLELLVALLNTGAVDARYRRVSGTAAVSVSLLRQIDLPRPDTFSAALATACGDAEAAAEQAYLAQPQTVDL